MIWSVAGTPANRSTPDDLLTQRPFHALAFVRSCSASIFIAAYKMMR
jgi:hypothetical protein